MRRGEEDLDENNKEEIKLGENKMGVMPVNKLLILSLIHISNQVYKQLKKEENQDA